MNGSKWYQAITFLVMAAVSTIFAASLGRAETSGALPSAVSSSTSDNPLKADAEYSRVFAEFLRVATVPSGEAKERATAEGIDRLRQLLAKDRIRFVQQLVLFSSEARGQNDPLRNTAPFAMFNIIQLLDVRKDPGLMIAAMIPFLGVKDEGISRCVNSILRDIETHTDGVSFDTYANILGANFAARGKELPRPLLIYMIHSDPSMGLLAIDKSLPGAPELRRQIRWTDHVVQDYLWKVAEHRTSGNAELDLAKTELMQLLSRGDWWARLYVAEIVNRNAALRSPDLVKQLLEDADPTVKDALNAQEQVER
jgi:hypothetical protein